MACFPDVLERAQEEIDRVVGQDRLPSFSDRSNLPYIDALVKESFRWWNVAPISTFFNHLIFKQLRLRHQYFRLDFPHLAVEEDTYMGYRIPKGSSVITNIW